MKQKIIFITSILCLTFFFISTIRSQWVQTNGPEGGRITAFAVSGTNHFAGTDNGGIFLTTNNGVSWKAINNGLPLGSTVQALAASNTTLLAGIASVIYVSTDNGASWVEHSDNHINSLHSFAISGTNLFAGTGNGVFLSTNNGTSWTAVNSGLTSYVRSLAVIGTDLFAGTDASGVFRSTNNGTSWMPVNNGLGFAYVRILYANGTNLFATSVDAVGVVSLSTDNGANWTKVNSGLPHSVVLALAASDKNLFAATYDNGIYISTNNGTNWEPVNVGLTKSFTSLASVGTNIFAGAYLDGVYLSTNSGTDWKPANTGLINTTVLASVIIGTNLFAGTIGSGTFLSSDDGNSWTAINKGLAGFSIICFAVSGNNLYAGTGDSGVYLSTNNGTNWTQINTGLGVRRNVVTMGVIGTKIFVSIFGLNQKTALFVSSNDGATWTPDSNFTNVTVTSFANDDRNIYLGCSSGVFRSTDSGISWQKINSGLEAGSINSLALDGSNLIAATLSGVYLSTNEGLSWSLVKNKEAYELAVNDGKFFMGRAGGGMLFSSDKGTSWKELNEGMPFQIPIKAFAFSKTHVFVATIGVGVWKRSLSDLEINSVKSSLNTEKSFRISPNPAENSLTIQSSKNLNNAQCNLFDQLGRSVLRREGLDFIGDKKVTLDVSNIPSGMYYLRMTADGISRSEAVVIAR